ncbi:MAG TPA: hypothetical protein VLI07_16660 [Candidatus Binatus sp.]|jgi:hypothetical protein|nr:hypothetical protein [Candidatus Binatus sp.]
MIVVRFLFVLLLGVILGIAATVYLIHSGAGDLVIRRTEAVQDMERRLHDVEQQRDSLSRQLDDVVGRAGRMEASFGALEKRFHELEQQLEQAHPGGERPAG